MSIEERPPAVAPQSPQEALIALAQLQERQVATLEKIQAELEEQGRALTDIANHTQQMRDQWRLDLPQWGRMRSYIGCTFWLLIGIPLIVSVLAVLAAWLGAFGLFAR